MRARAEDADRLVTGTRTEAEPGRESAAVDAALAGWRRRAANLLLAVTAVVHLPPTALAMLGPGPAIGRHMLAFGATAYLVMLASALLRRVDYRARLWAYFVAAYVVVALTNLVHDRGQRNRKESPMTLRVTTKNEDRRGDSRSFNNLRLSSKRDDRENH